MGGARVCVCTLVVPTQRRKKGKVREVKKKKRKKQERKQCVKKGGCQDGKKGSETPKNTNNANNTKETKNAKIPLQPHPATDHSHRYRYITSFPPPIPSSRRVCKCVCCLLVVCEFVYPCALDPSTYVCRKEQSKINVCGAMGIGRSSFGTAPFYFFYCILTPVSIQL